MADRVYGIHQSQPRDLAALFKTKKQVSGLEDDINQIYTLESVRASNRQRTSFGVDLIVGDQIDYYDEFLADNRIRRYSKVHLYFVAHSSADGFTKEQVFRSLAKIGYTEIEGISEGATGAEMLAETKEVDQGQYVNIVSYLHVAVKAGQPRYIGRLSEPLASQSGYEFTGGFSDSLSTNVLYTQEMADNGRWLRFGFSEAARQVKDVAYFPTGTDYDSSKGLFGGQFLPEGIEALFDYTYSDLDGYSVAKTNGDLQYTAANGSFDVSGCRPGDLVLVRFDFNIVPQFANTTIEVGIIWQTQSNLGQPTATFPLTTQPIFYGQGTVGKTFLNRPLISAYIASHEDVNAKALLAVKSDKPVQLQPLTTLCAINR